MALFYPAALGIVGQKMTSLQHRLLGDAEDPHDEQYLLSTQSKQDQVQHLSLSFVWGHLEILWIKWLFVTVQ